MSQTTLRSTPGSQPGTESAEDSWWTTAVVYQVYIRSFSDGNGDGIGDIAGLRAALPYLADLGVDAIWINPWYPSPMADAGYDVADYRAIEPAYGTLADAEALISDAHDLDIRVILDIVPNHTSDEHEWFAPLLDSRETAESRERAGRRFVVRPGRGDDGAEPPNDWQSVFGGPAWTRLTELDGTPGDWYLHLFAPKQPDLDWQSDDVRAEFESILRFWFDKGVDGFRIDVAHGLVKDPALPDSPVADGVAIHSVRHPAWDQDGVHEIYRAWRSVANEYPDRVFVAEAWVPDNERLARYLRPDELHTAFQFDFLRAPWRAETQRGVIDDALAQAAGVDAPATWVLGNHDVVRPVTRYSRSQPDHLVESEWERNRWDTESRDLALGRRRARAAALLQLSLPGTAYLYQGDELALDEVEDLPDHVRQDPTWAQSNGTDVGRDGCRVPLPWSGHVAPYGFTDGTAETWLPQPSGWGSVTVEAQDVDPDSTLALYRAALRIRRDHWVEAGDVRWLDAPPGVLAFERPVPGGRLRCWVDTGGVDVDLAETGRVLLASTPDVAVGADLRTLPADSCVWTIEADR